MTVVGHIFQLNTAVLSVAGVSGLSLEATVTANAEPSTSAGSDQTHVQDLKALRLNENGATCIACGIGLSLPGFESAAEQREHFKTDWHRYNVKRRLHNQPPASEDHFASLIKDQEDQVSSISGSSSESEQSGEDEEAGRKLTSAYQINNQLPQFVFKTADERYFAVWRCLLFQDHALRGATAAALADTSQQLADLGRLVDSAAPTWVLIMLRGGHFAAAVLRGRGGAARTLGAQAQPAASAAGPGPGTAAGAGAGASTNELPFDVVVSKTFHRYVVRAKAGGKQSTKDGTGKFARSAGSRLRRYNEVALERDVQELLSSWSQHLAAAQLVFVHAPSSNSKAVFGPGGGAAAPLAASDPRVRRVPFMTQRPTFSEVKRVARLLSCVFEVPAEQVVVPGSEDKATEKEKAGRQPAPAPAEKAAGPPKAKEQQHLDDASSVPAQAPVLGRTMPLHRAAKAGDADKVAQLLEAGQDPCQRDEHGVVPYLLAADKAVRDAFRRFMASQPDKWDYAEAAVPSALTQEMESAQLAKKAEKKAKMKAKEKGRKVVDEDSKAAAAAAAADALDKEIAAAAAEAAALSARLGNARASAAAPTSKVGGAGASRGAGAGASAAGLAAGRARSAAQQKQQPPGRPQQPQLPPTPEEMARRRETMAAAAEARMRALQQHAQQQQLWSV